MEYSKELITKAVGKICDLCNTIITEEQAAKDDFLYSKTSNHKEFYIHSKCFGELYGRR